jgi:hypothetical protein
LGMCRNSQIARPELSEFVLLILADNDDSPDDFSGLLRC